MPHSAQLPAVLTAGIVLLYLSTPVVAQQTPSPPPIIAAGGTETFASFTPGAGGSIDPNPNTTLRVAQQSANVAAGEVQVHSAIVGGVNTDAEAVAFLFNVFDVATAAAGSQVLTAQFNVDADWNGLLSGVGIFGTSAEFELRAVLVDRGDPTSANFPQQQVAATAGIHSVSIGGIALLGASVDSGSNAITFSSQVRRGHRYHLRFEATCISESGLFGADVFCEYGGPLTAVLPDFVHNGFVQLNSWSVSLDSDPNELLAAINEKVCEVENQLGDVEDLITSKHQQTRGVLFSAITLNDDTNRDTIIANDNANKAALEFSVNGNSDSNRATVISDALTNKTDILNTMGINLTAITSRDDSNRDQVIVNASSNLITLLQDHGTQTNTITANDNANRASIVSNINGNATLILANDNSNLNTILARDDSNAADVKAHDDLNRFLITTNDNTNRDTILDAIDDAEELLSDLTVENKLFNQECVPSLWLPAAEDGLLERSRNHVADLISRAASSGDQDANIVAAQARLALADGLIAQSRFQQACHQLAHALRAISNISGDDDSDDDSSDDTQVPPPGVRTSVPGTGAGQADFAPRR